MSEDCKECRVLDITICSSCGDVIIALPEGGGLCVMCADEMAKSQ